MSRELHYYNKYKCPVCGCEHIIIIYDKEYHYASDDEKVIRTIKCDNCKTEMVSESDNFLNSKLYKLWLKEDKPEKIQYPFSPEGSSYILDEFLMKVCNLYKNI